MKKSFSTPWTHEFFADLKFYLLLALFSFDLCEVSAFCFLHSDNENPKKNAATTLSVEATAADEPSLQEAAPVVKSPKDPVKRVSSTRGSKHLKKSTDAGASLDTHRSTSSSDDVPIDPDIFSLFLHELPTHVFFWRDLDEEVRLFRH
jgi:hypothetical protein